MANDLSPTAANIISSLGIKGATVSEALPGYVPVLGPDGTLSARFIPADAAQASLPALSDAAFVDPNTSVAESLRKGSVEAPYKTLGEAAEKFRPSASAQNLKTVAFVLAPGIYDDDGNVTVDFGTGWNVAYPSRGNPSKVYFIGLGGCRFYRDIVVSGMDASASDQSVVFQNVDLGETNGITVLGNATVTLLGRTYVGGTLSSGSEEVGGTRTPTNVGTLRLSADAYVGSPYAASIEYLSSASRVANTSSVVGTTVEDALDRLGSRKIRVPKVTGSGSGLAASSYEYVSAESSGGYDVYRLGDNESALIGAIKDLYEKLENVDAETVTARKITATEELEAKTLSIDALVLGGFRIEVDTYGYLVVSDGGGGRDVPSGTVVLMDVGDGSLWLLGVSNGRLFVERFYDEESSSSESGSSTTYPDSIDLIDLGVEYKVEIANGRMFITKAGAT